MEAKRENLKVWNLEPALEVGIIDYLTFLKLISEVPIGEKDEYANNDNS